MLMLTGMLVNIFKAPDGVQRDTGEVYKGKCKGQILAGEALKNGQERQVLVDLRTDTPEAFEGLTGQQVSVQVRATAYKSGLYFAHLEGTPVKSLGSAKTAKA